eukprot:4481407-Prymnesium_polylepis.1
MLHVVPSPEVRGSCCRLAKYSWYAGEPTGWPLGRVTFPQAVICYVSAQPQVALTANTAFVGGAQKATAIIWQTVQHDDVRLRLLQPEVLRREVGGVLRKALCG